MRIFHDDVNVLVFEELHFNDVFTFQGEKLELVNGKVNVSNIDIGKYQYVQSAIHGKVLIEQRFIVKTGFFDQNFTDKDVQLGSYIKDESTYFNIWSPTSVGVALQIDGKNLEMLRSAKGVYSIKLDGNMSGKSYLFEIDINGQKVLTCDPYAKATLPNRKASVVVDLTFDKVTIGETNNVILEMHVRDFSMDPKVPFKHRGELLGLLESHGNYGMAHVLDLGVGVVQLQPLTDFETVDELDKFKAYNWGYDPMQFFALEGSYSSNINDPLQVLRDFSTVVNTYHMNNIKVTMDVVFNHIYEVMDSSLHASVPYYYFRYVDGKLSDGTFCGNEIASEFTMVRKFIVDACKYFVDQFDIDGYRFDLMGITDITTMNEIRNTLIKVKPNVLLYGEGWNMKCGLPEKDRATMQNHKYLEGYSFFNDKFRNAISGSLDGSDHGILSNTDTTLIDDVLNGSLSIIESPKQSINYVECHDNYSLADKIEIMGLDESFAKVFIEASIKAHGYAFLQIGQSFFRNKQGVENSYKSSDDVNMIRWSYLDKYKELNEFTKALIKHKISTKENKLHWNGKAIV